VLPYGPKAAQVTLVSNNLREFERVAALQLANWAI
jgi:predicted nucleic acid-binding protein